MAFATPDNLGDIYTSWDTIEKFPYKRKFYKKSQILKAFDDLKNYDYKQNVSHNFCKIDLKLHLNVSRVFNGKPTTLVSQDSDYITYMMLSDMFQEKCRIKCALINRESPKKFFKHNKQKIFEDAKTDYGVVTDFSLRESIYKLTKECTNHRPTLSKTFIDMFNLKTILDFSTGWGDRIIGFLASNADVYYGFDPNPCLYKGYQKILKYFNPENKKQVKLHMMPFEEVANDKNLMDELKESIDGVYTSPPYFVIEKYTKHKNQSISNYTDEKLWYDLFLKKAIDISIHSLKINGYLILNINQKHDNNYIEKMISYINDMSEMKYLGIIAYSTPELKNGQPIFIWQKYNRI